MPRRHIHCMESTCKIVKSRAWRQLKSLPWPKGPISEVRVYGGAKFGHAGRWSIAKCRFSTKGSFDYHGKAEKENVKSSSKNEKTWISSEVCQKKWWIRYRLRMRGCLCKSWKREAGKESMIESSLGPGVFPTECPQEHTACTDLLCRSSEGTSNNRLWSP